MPATIRPRRSILYVPGDKPRALEKARSLDADGIIFDLEDAVAPENKDAARQAIAEAVGSGGYGHRELILRVSALDCEEDFALAHALEIDGVLLPKVDSPATVHAGAQRTRHALWCMIETPLGVLRAAEIAGASDRLAGFVAGTNDLVKELGARHTPDRTPLLTSLSLMLLGARAHGLAALDGVHISLDDPEGFEAACRQAVELGFDGKTLVHPDTIEPANRIFAPAAEEIASARAMVAAWQEARAQGLGVARVSGKMVEQLHVDEAERLLALAEAIERR
jgi:citrate lyase subunit beta / citryl-CoA lyase